MATASQRAIRKVFHCVRQGATVGLTAADRATIEAANSTADDRVLAALVRRYESGATLNWSAADRATIETYGGGSTADQRLLKGLVKKAEGDPAGLTALSPADFTTADSWT